MKCNAIQHRYHSHFQIVAVKVEKDCCDYFDPNVPMFITIAQQITVMLWKTTRCVLLYSFYIFLVSMVIEDKSRYMAHRLCDYSYLQSPSGPPFTNMV